MGRARAGRSRRPTATFLGDEGETGNIDHLVAGLSGVFMVESKTRGYLDSELRRATGRATRLGRELGVYVKAVITLHRRDRAPFEHQNVASVPEQHLLGWIRSQHSKTVPFERLARLADRVVWQQSLTAARPTQGDCGVAPVPCRRSANAE